MVSPPHCAGWTVSRARLARLPSAACSRRGGSLGTVLTILLTIFIALFALALLTGRTNIGVVRSLVPRMMTLDWC